MRCELIPKFVNLKYLINEDGSTVWRQDSSRVKIVESQYGNLVFLLCSGKLKFYRTEDLVAHTFEGAPLHPVEIKEEKNGRTLYDKVTKRFINRSGINVFIDTRNGIQETKSHVMFYNPELTDNTPSHVARQRELGLPVH